MFCPKCKKEIIYDAYCYDCRFDLYAEYLERQEAERVLPDGYESKMGEEDDGEEEFVIIQTELFKYNGEGGHVVIPEGVESINERAFSDVKETLLSVIFPSTLKLIDGDAFSECVELKSVTLPEGLTELCTNAFRGCEALERVIIPSSLKCIPERAFAYCSSLTTLILNEGVELMEESAFEGCYNLPRLVLPDSVTYVGKRAFYECMSLLSVTVGRGLSSYTDVAEDAFGKCAAIEVVNRSEQALYPKNTDLGDLTFNATEIHRDGVSRIDVSDGFWFYTYDGIPYLIHTTERGENIVLPDNYRGKPYSVRASAGIGGNGTHSVTVGESVFEIQPYALYACDELIFRNPAGWRSDKSLLPLKLSDPRKNAERITTKRGERLYRK